VKIAPDMKVNEMSKTCGTCSRDKNIHEILIIKPAGKDLHIDERIILRFI
jgi:hypothetical protein